MDVALIVALALVGLLIATVAAMVILKYGKGGD
jgi:hypothetical protein